MTTATARPIVLLIGTDHSLEIPSLTNALLGEVVADAAVEATLYDAAGEEVGGQAWPIILSEDPLVEGRYLGTLGAELEITEEQHLTLVVVADGGAGLKRTWRIPAVARWGRY